MKNENVQSSRLEGKVRDSFRLLELIAATFSAQAYKAIDLISRDEVVLWITRAPIVREEVDRFVLRLAKVAAQVKRPSISQFGVDQENVGYAVIPPYTRHSLHWGAESVEQLERRFLDCLHIIEGLHAKAIFCGDLCPESFAVDDTGVVGLFAVLGDVNLEEKEANSGLEEYRRFRPQEQDLGEVQGASTDVFALAWIADDIFTPKAGDQMTKGIVPPRWVKNALKATSSSDGRREMSSALLLRMLIKEVEESAQDNCQEPRSAVDFALVMAPGAGDEREHVRNPDAADAKKSSIAASGKKKSNSITRAQVLFFLNILALGVILTSFVFEPGPKLVGDAPVERFQPSATSEFLNLVNSDDSGAHDTLLEQLRLSKDPVRTESLGRGVVQRSRRLGLRRVADTALTYVKQHGGFQSFQGAVGQGLLELLDPAKPLDRRLQGVVDLYGLEPRVGVMIAASLALDTGSEDAFWGIFARASADGLGVADGREFSPVALMLLLPESRDLCVEDLLALRDKLSPKDMRMLLSELGNRGSADVSLIAAVADERKLVGGVHRIFLVELEANHSIDSILRAALVSGALGRLTEAHTRIFGHWYGEGAPRALQATILTSDDSVVRNAAFEILRSKPISDVYVAKVLEFVQTAYRERSGEFSRLVAALALRDELSRDSLRENLDGLHKAPRLKELLRRVVRGAPADIVEETLDLYEREIDPVDTIDLLSNPDRRIRLAALSHLSHVNDALLLTLIRQAYDEEKDAEVRTAYRSKIPFIGGLRGSAQLS